MKHATSLAAAAVVCMLLLGCTSSDDTPTAAIDAVVDFALIDVNDTSLTSGLTVSPRDYLGQVSAWYFGHST